MAINTINLNITTQGITALNNILANNTTFSITKVELSNNLIPNVDPNVWQPDGGIGAPYYIQTSNVVALSAAANDVFVMDMQLNETIPLPVVFGGGNINGWSSSPETYINIGSFALFITNPTTHAVVPFLLGYFNATTIQKYSNTVALPGNYIDIFNNMELAPFSTDAIVYNLTQIVNAQVAYLNYIYNLPVPASDISNAFILNDISALCFTDYKKWYFNNYTQIANNTALTAVSGSAFTSAALYNSLPAYLRNSSNTFGSNSLVAEICNAAGVMKKCFVILSSSGNIFTTNTVLPAFVAGDTVTAFSYLLDNVAAQKVLSSPVSISATSTIPVGQVWTTLTANNVVVTLPSLASVQGQTYTVKVLNYTGCSIIAAGANTIDGGLTSLAVNNYDCLYLTATSTTWLLG